MKLEHRDYIIKLLDTKRDDLNHSIKYLKSRIDDDAIIQINKNITAIEEMLDAIGLIPIDDLEEVEK